MSRALVVYAVSDPDGSSTFPTKRAALAEARERVASHLAKHTGSAGSIEVQRVTIPGPFNRDLVCKLLSSGGYASEVVTNLESKRVTPMTKSIDHTSAQAHRRLTRQYRVPHIRRIGRGDETAALYAAEEKATAALGAAARELERVLVAHGVLATPVDHARDVRSEAILTMLDAQDHSAALVACMAFLDYYKSDHPDAFRSALIDWEDQRANVCPVCEGPVRS